MKSALSLFSLLVLFTMACKNVPKDDFTVIDGIKIGTNQQAFFSACDSLGIKNENFVTVPFMGTIRDLNKYYVSGYTTTVFNIGPYSGNGLHLGLYQPHSFIGSDIIYELIVMIGNKGQVVFFDNMEEHQYNSFTQDVNVELLTEIEAQLLQKYGPPKDTIYDENIFLYSIYGSKEVEKLIQGAGQNGKLLIWETPSLQIVFFNGIRSSRSIYNEEWQTYEVSLSGDGNSNLVPKQIRCRSYPYIIYRIKDEIIERMGIAKPKL